MRKLFAVGNVLLLMIMTGFASAYQETGTHVLNVPGRIAYVGEDHNIYSLRLHDGELTALTNDATAARHYQWPMWSVDDRLVYFCCDPAFSNTFDVAAYVSDDGIGPGRVEFSSNFEVFTYAYWSPRNLGTDETSRELALLLNQYPSRGFVVRLINSGDDTQDSQLLGSGAPFYFSWSPDGSRMLWQRNNRRLDVYSFETDETTSVGLLPGAFQAPAWSPVDDRLLVAVLSGDLRGTNLSVITQDSTQVLRSDLTGLISFSWSPDGNYVAYRTIVDNRLSALSILDAITGEVVATTRAEGAIAFFWSPNSRYIAYITPGVAPGTFSTRPSGNNMMVGSAQQQNPGLAWSVIDVASGNTRRYGNFMPTTEMIYLLTFFDQFAQSHRVWSPDSRYVVFGEVIPDNTPAISILDMTRTDAVPFFIADGVIGFWSYN